MIPTELINFSVVAIIAAARTWKITPPAPAPYTAIRHNHRSRSGRCFGGPFAGTLGDLSGGSSGGRLAPKTTGSQLAIGLHRKPDQ